MYIIWMVLRDDVCLMSSIQHLCSHFVKLAQFLSNSSYTFFAKQYEVVQQLLVKKIHMKYLSKWFSLCLVALLAFSVSAFAQDEDYSEEDPVVVYDPDDIEGKRNLTANKFVVGGNGNFWIAGNTLFFELSPFLAYRPVDRLLVGTGMNYSNQVVRQNFGGGVTTSESLKFIGGRALARYLLFHIGDPAGIYGTAEYQYNTIRYTFNGERIPLEDDKKSSMFLGAGYSTNFYQGMGVTFELMYDLLWEEGVSFSEFPINYRVGFTYGF